MTEPQPQPRARFRFFRRALKALLFLLVALVLVGFAGVAVVWGHFWDFQVGTPSSETCGSCHILEDYVNTLTDSTMLASNHARNDIGCVDCHAYDLDQQLTETIAYLQGDYDQPFFRAKYEMDTCFACHEHQSYDQLAWRTTDLGVTDAQAGGHDANPHQPPHYSELECHTCHRMHRPSVLLCSECHAYEFSMPMEQVQTDS